jgi:hypothetical protein
MAGPLSKFSPDGRYLWTKYPDGRGHGHLHLTTLDSHGRLLLVNDDDASVLYVSQDGRTVDRFDSENGPIGCDSSVDDEGDVFVVPCDATTPLYEYDREHRLVGELLPHELPVWTAPVAGPGKDWWALTYDGRLARLRLT